MADAVRISRLAAAAMTALAFGAFAGSYVAGATPHPGFCPCGVCAGQGDPGAVVAPVSDDPAGNAAQTEG